MNPTRIPAVLTVVVLAGLLGACSDTPAQTAAPTTPAPVTVTVTPAPVQTPQAEPTPTGKPTYTPDPDTTETAPVRIGDDTPGKAPKAEKNYTRENWREYVAAADKYVVAVGRGDEGWLWKVFGESHGGMSEIADSGYTRGEYLPSREAAAAGPFIVDGRVLDRAEYILVVN